VLCTAWCNSQKLLRMYKRGKECQFMNDVPQ
jgi:hypothetical protein